MAGNYEQQPFDPGPFIDNPGPRCPCLLLLDVSASMTGRPMEELNAGLVLLKDELSADSLASKRVQIGVVTFGPVVPGFGQTLTKKLTEWRRKIEARFNA
jgi:hypothetical protein